MALVTKQYVENFISTKSPEQVAQFVGRALVVVFNNQTAGEKQVNNTSEDNGVGFTGADAHSGSITAKYFLKHRTLLDWQVERWTKRNKNGTMRISKYWRQLDAAAQAKAKKSTISVSTGSGYITTNNAVRSFKDQEAAKTSAAISASMDRARAEQAANAKPKPTYSAFAKPRSFKDIDIARQEAEAAERAEADLAEYEVKCMIEEAKRMSAETSRLIETEKNIVSEEEAKVLAKLNQWAEA
jgi:hypothetical protein